MLLVLTFLGGLSSGTSVQSLVENLGPNSDSHSIEAIAEYNCKAIPYLTRQLQVVQPSQVNFNEAELYPDEMRVVWSIAALRYISGKDFYAKQARKVTLDSPRDQMLHSGAPQGQTKLFGVWMSRGLVYFASASDQAKIIESWRRYESSKACKPGRRKNRDISFWLYGVKS